MFAQELPEGAASISAQEVQGNAEPPCLDGVPPQAVEEGTSRDGNRKTNYHLLHFLDCF